MSHRSRVRHSTALSGVLALCLVADVVRADGRTELFDVAKPFAPGAKVETTDASAAMFWGSYQIGHLGGRRFRIFPDGSASIGLGPALDEERVDVACDSETKTCRISRSDASDLVVTPKDGYKLDRAAYDLPSLDIAKGFASEVLAVYAKPKAESAPVAEKETKSASAAKGENEKTNKPNAEPASKGSADRKMVSQTPKPSPETHASKPIELAKTKDVASPTTAKSDTSPKADTKEPAKDDAVAAADQAKPGTKRDDKPAQARAGTVATDCAPKTANAKPAPQALKAPAKANTAEKTTARKPAPTKPAATQRECAPEAPSKTLPKAPGKFAESAKSAIETAKTIDLAVLKTAEKSIIIEAAKPSGETSPGAERKEATAPSESKPNAKQSVALKTANAPVKVTQAAVPDKSESETKIATAAIKPAATKATRDVVAITGGTAGTGAPGIVVLDRKLDAKPAKPVAIAKGGSAPKAETVEAKTEQPASSPVAKPASSTPGKPKAAPAKPKAAAVKPKPAAKTDRPIEPAAPGIAAADSLLTKIVASAPTVEPIDNRPAAAGLDQAMIEEIARLLRELSAKKPAVAVPSTAAPTPSDARVLVEIEVKNAKSLEEKTTAAAAPSATASKSAPIDPSTIGFISITQRELKRIGAFSGPVDGQLNDATVAAIELSETLSGLERTGRPSLALLEILAVRADARPKAQSNARPVTTQKPFADTKTEVKAKAKGKPAAAPTEAAAPKDRAALEPAAGKTDTAKKPAAAKPRSTQPNKVQSHPDRSVPGESGTGEPGKSQPLAGPERSRMNSAVLALKPVEAPEKLLPAVKPSPAPLSFDLTSPTPVEDASAEGQASLAAVPRPRWRPDFDRLKKKLKRSLGTPAPAPKKRDPWAFLGSRN
ncbi:hypothetical protein [Fulvimarina sp. MAC3]|uniref:peptidoglycan-binding domain-containing protein n=1 Tax=Fulvimarina sp. MAC3 TaxID=3148887 RepID=UPI0031FBCE60